MANLVVNTAARIEINANDGGMEVEIEAPIRGEGVRVTRISEQRQPDAFRLLKRVGAALDPQKLMLSQKDIGLLAQFGILILDSNFPTDVPLDLRTAMPQLEDNPLQIRFQNTGLDLPDVPLEVPDGGEVVWIQDRLRGIWCPYMLTRRQFEAVQRIMAGSSPWGLGNAICEELSQTGILDFSRDI